VSEHLHPQTGQPVGDQPAPRPGPVTLAGRYGRVEKLMPGALNGVTE